MIMAAVAALASMPFAGAASGGPDAGGYYWTDGASNFVDISHTGTAFGTSCDDCDVGVLTLPFAFNYYGAAQTTLGVCSNGYLQVGYTGYCPYYGYSWSSFTSVIAPFFDDLWVQTNEGDNVYHQVIGAPGSQVEIIQWNVVHHYRNDATIVTFEVKLFEGSDRIEADWSHVGGGPVNWNCQVVGIAGPSGPTTTYADQCGGGLGYSALDGRGVVFQPRSAPPAPLPELSTLVLASVGVTAVLGMVVFRRK